MQWSTSVAWPLISTAIAVGLELADVERSVTNFVWGVSLGAGLVWFATRARRPGRATPTGADGERVSRMIRYRQLLDLYAEGCYLLADVVHAPPDGVAAADARVGMWVDRCRTHIARDISGAAADRFVNSGPPVSDGRPQDRLRVDVQRKLVGLEALMREQFGEFHNAAAELEGSR